MALRALLLGVVALAAVACGDSPSSPSSSGSRFFLRLTDSKYGAAPAVLVTFSGVRAFRTPGDWTAVPLQNGAAQFTCDLRKLQSSDGEIAVGPLPPGRYSEVRLRIQSATLYLDNASDFTCTANVRVPGGRATPMTVVPAEVVLANEFRVEAAADTTMRVGLNSESSIRAGSDGSYTFQPVITVLSVN